MKSNRLEKNLGLLDIFCLSSGAMISSGIFILPGLAYREAGPMVFLSYLLAGILALLGTLSVAELATAMPKAGGDYFFITRSLGPLVGTISSFLSWSALCLKSAFAIFGIAEIVYLSLGIPIFISSFFICSFFIGLNVFGAKESAKFEVFLVVGLFMIMLLLVAGGYRKILPAHFDPLMPYGFNKVLATAGFVFISFGGLLNIATVSGEVKNPKKNIPLGMMLSVLAVTVIYALTLVVVVGLLPGSLLASSLTPVADAGRIVFGNFGYVIISIGALLAFVTTANAGILSASRYPLALSKDNLIPGFISSLTKRKKTPFVAVILTGLFILFCLLLDLTTLVKLGSIVILTVYILTNIAVIILREGKIQNYQPAFRIPFYPWLNILSIVLFSIIIIDMGLVAIEESLLMVGAAASVYFLYGRKKHKIDFALLHLIERIIDKKLTADTLENELKQVIIDRDELKIDRFHDLVENSAVMDFHESVSLDSFLESLADETAEDINIEKDTVIELFKAREEEGSTAITPFVAIPHIIIPGQNKFKLVVVRCKEGIQFNKENNAVKAVFVLFGTKDERMFHLKVLSAVAYIVQSRQFEKVWMNARNKQQLKDILLLSERKR